MDQIEIGLRAERVVTVTNDMTATSLGSGSLPIYSTAAMIALMEAAALDTVEHLLPDGQASAGLSFDITHHAATPVGEEVRAQAEVIDIQGQQIVFEVRAWDNEDLIGEGTHTRVVIDASRLLDQLA